MPRKENTEGRKEWDRDRHAIPIGDSLFHPREKNMRMKGRHNRKFEVVLGTVMIPQPEPIFRQHMVTVEMTKGGGLLTHVAWPGAQVNANPAGFAGGASLGIHGLWASPLQGQQVAVGFVDGDDHNPVVLERYPYNASQRIDLEALHTLPLTQKLHGPTDVVLGHHLGSYVALRGTIPIPASIDVFAPTAITARTLGFMLVDVAGVYNTNVGGAYLVNVGGAASITAGAAVTVTAGGAATFSAGAGMSLAAGAALAVSAIGVANIAAGGAVSITAGAAVSVLAAGAVSIAAGGAVSVTAIGAILMQASTGVTVNAGVRPVAALGDKTVTGIPIIATGLFLRVP